MKLRVAVTGGSGRIGGFVIRELIGRGHEVVNLDRRQSADPVARFVYAELGRREQVQPVLEQVDAVCHLGEIPSAHAAMSPEEIYFRNTRAGSVVIQTAADLKLKRVVYTSSCQVYGMWDNGPAAPARMPFDETQPLAPHNVYALAKVANEGYARLAAQRHGLSVAAFRFPMVLVEAFTPQWSEAVKKRTGRLDGFGTYLHATDAARAFALAVEQPRDGFEAYHFCAPEIMSAVPLAQALAAQSPGFTPLPADWPALKSPMLTGKARDHFGWSAAWNFLDHCRAKDAVAPA
jgi:nucleoside-diphosphate-sugar epimerase